ncbi:translation initiation factor IF-2-like [Lutra lutra]|uniref:translation initiation factor IF-2-like n=1 Tax=Lutra lutra TaxID=9657 RepID=UPI001FD5C3EC|nr:translation initiation factor IF-2-like [Lutra lutra]
MDQRGAHLAPKPRGSVRGARSSPHRPLAFTNGPEADQDRRQGPGTAAPPPLPRRDPPAGSANTCDFAAGSRARTVSLPSPRPTRSTTRADSPATAGAGLGLSSPEAAARVRPARPPRAAHNPPPAARRSRPPPGAQCGNGPCLPRDRREARPARPAGVVLSAAPPRRPGRFHNGSASTVGRPAVSPLAHPPLPETGPAPRSPATQPHRQGGPARRPALPAAGRSSPVRPPEPPPQPPPRVGSPASAPQAADGWREASDQSAPRAFGSASNQRNAQFRLRPYYPTATQEWRRPEPGAPRWAGQGKWTARCGRCSGPGPRGRARGPARPALPDPGADSRRPVAAVQNAGQQGVGGPGDL